MLTLIYDAVLGRPIADGLVERYVDRLQRKLERGEDVVCVFSTDNVLNAIRVRIRNKVIPLDSVRLLYRRGPDGWANKDQSDQELRIYPSAGIAPWPDGFCDRIETYLMELL